MLGMTTLSIVFNDKTTIFWSFDMSCNERRKAMSQFLVKQPVSDNFNPVKLDMLNEAFLQSFTDVILSWTAVHGSFSLTWERISSSSILDENVQFFSPLFI